MDSHPAIAISAVLAALLAIRISLWYLLKLIVSCVPTLLSSNWPRADAILSRIRLSHPTIFAFSRARLNPAVFRGLPLTLMCLAAIYVAALIGGLADDVREADGMVRLDNGLNTFFLPYRAGWLVNVVRWITALGAGPAITMVACSASALLWSQGQVRVVPPLWIALAGAEATTWVSKYAIGRVRPQLLDGIAAASPSFPSGHATASTALFGFLAFAVARNLPELRPRFEVIFWTAAFIGLICASRTFLSLHYLSDVVAGVLVGVFWLLVGFTVVQLDQRSTSSRRQLP